MRCTMVPPVCDKINTQNLTWGVRECLVFVIIRKTTLNMWCNVKGCLFDYHKHEALTYTPPVKGCLIDYHKQGALPYTPMLRVVYLIDHKHGALTYTPC
jgi:hypothetical protein